MSEALDLTPLDRGLERLVQATSGPRTAPAILREGRELAEAWSSEVRSEGLVRTGAYAGSITVKTDRVGAGSVSVGVGTDLGYPNVLEHGDRFISPHPAGRTAFEREEAALVSAIENELRQLITEGT